MEYSLSAQRKFILVLFLVGFLMGLGIDLYVPSLPAITNYFHTQPSLVQLTIGLYMLGYGVAQVFLGVLSDSLGRKKILVTSGLVYSLVSFLTAFSPNIYALNVLRFFQGISIAGMAVVTRAMAVDCFTGKDLAKATSYFGLSWSLGPILGPFIGGYLQHYFGWQANFYLLGVYGLVISIFVYMKIPETNLQLIPLNFQQVYKNIQDVTTHPLFLFTTFIGGFAYAIIVVFNIVGPFLIQTVLNYSVVDYGYIALLLGVTYFFGCMSNRLLINCFNIMLLLRIALVGALLGSIGMVFLSVTIGITLFDLLCPVVLILFLCGFIIPCSLAKSMSIFPNAAGTASSVFGALTGIIVALVTMSASTLKTSTQFPMSVTYFVLLTMSLILFYTCQKIENNEGKSSMKQ
jgi:Bcr/CflA subfamily drug resistance transporter